MAGASDVLACQQRLASVLERMLALARDGQWKKLPELDTQCVALAGRLRALELPDPSPDERASIAQLFERIGADQVELTQLVRPQFVTLMARISEQYRPRDRMPGRKSTHDPEKCPPGGARSSAGSHPH